ncbi:MAG: ABC transporter ATP-binding protein [Candidatus Krumholzibacteriota bacterium]|nr:ABC transporter ATP-binding protein [Candidatus Krumholzibacteriota bacterium]
MNKILLAVEDLYCAIGGREILRALSFTVRESEYLSLIGPNGAGKTTLLRCIMRIVPFQGGAISLLDMPLEGYSQKKLARYLSYVPQSEDRYLPFTVEEFVMMGRYPHLSPFSTPRTEDREAVESALRMTETAPLAQRKFHTLSGGEKQMAFIAAALSQQPRLLLLDEPTTFLDPRHAEKIHRLLRGINRRLNIAILSVTHDINNAVLLGDRVLILKEGGVKYCGAAGSVMQGGLLEETYDKTFSYTRHPQTGERIIVPDVINHEG